MAAASIGTDTGGSCRIQPAFTGIVGFKPTASRLPREGVFPLSQTLDAVGPLAHSVGCCATLRCDHERRRNRNDLPMHR